MNTGIVFPGQGSQATGMLAELSADHSEVQETFAEANDVLGKDLWAMCQAGPDDVLADTRVTQPLMLVSGVAVWRVLQHSDLPKPSVVAGHSLGEFAALVASEVLSFADALRLVKIRSELMATAVPEGTGGMAALLGLDDAQVIELCAELSGSRVTEAVNFNAPGQVAISGHLDALEKTVVEAKGRGARKAVMLAVSVPNHSSLMRDAGEQLASAIDGIEFSEPTIPIVQNLVAAAPADVQALVTNLKKHVYSPVQWTRSVEAIRDDFDVTLMFEAGPGKVLSGLNRRIDKQLRCLPVFSPDTLESAGAALTATEV
ncbi:MAG: ACP S-malonyltransferase [Gammaproteobacteria bacterium]|nr:ACP S-malonyltransferase [Gammaproteobacteria bacterium]